MGSMSFRPALAVALGLVLGLTAAHAAVDPFYTDRERDARAALVRGDPSEAARLFHIACFGMLEEPEQLGSCLVRLGVAEAKAQDSDGFDETFRRIVSIEDRFQAYTKADVDASERRAFAAAAADLLEPEELRLLPAVARAAEQARAQELAALAPRDRIARLEKLAEKNPHDARWPIQLARAELERGAPKAALSRLDGVNATDPADSHAIANLRGLADARLERCKDALTAFGAGAPDATAATAAAYVGCLHDRKRDEDARRFVASLSPALLDDPAVSAAVGELPQVKAPEDSDATPATEPGPVAARPEGNPAANPATNPPASLETEAAAAGSTESSAPPPATDPVSAPPPAAAASSAPPPVAPRSAGEEAEVELARRALGTATSRADLDAAIAELSPVAEGRPDDAEVQTVLATLAYRTSNWGLCARSFSRSGPAAADPPLSRFYRAVCLYEIGDRPGAVRALGDAGDRIKRTPFVDAYLKRILGSGAPGGPP